MEIKKIVNLLNGFNNELSNFRQKSGTIKTVQTMMKVTLMVQALDARQKKQKNKSSLCHYSDAYILVTGDIT